MDFLPLLHNLQEKPCLVVGAGEIAYRKAALLMQTGATVTVVDENKLPAFDHLIIPPSQYIPRKFQPSDLDNKVLIVSATDSERINRQVSSLAQDRNIPVNVVDAPTLSTVIFPAIVDRSPVIAAISSGGTSPVLTRKLRELLETLIPENIRNVAQFLGEQRQKLKRAFPDVRLRRKVTEAFFTSAGLELAKAKHPDAERYLYQMDAEQYQQGEVYIVGAGPGDPDLLTLKALQLMQQADIMLYDHLISDAILARARRDVRKIYVGKQEKSAATSQTAINEQLVYLARQGHRVLRLKGGDPFIFGRGGEEITNLIEARIPFYVVPGISAANGCAAYAGIPLTHRDYSQSVRFVTGHPKDGDVSLAWQEFSHQNQTIVFYMGLGGLKIICQKLIDYGRQPTTPIAVISKGTTPEQQIVVGTLKNIVKRVALAALSRPTLIIVGEVVALSTIF